MIVGSAFLNVAVIRNTIERFCANVCFPKIKTKTSKTALLCFDRI